MDEVAGRKLAKVEEIFNLPDGRQTGRQIDSIDSLHS